MKTIHRRKLTRDFTTLPNNLLREKSLSFAAKGILVMMLSHAETWEANMGDVEAFGFEGRKTIRRAVHQLEAAGYAVRHCVKDTASGMFVGTVWTWYDKPVPVEHRTKKPTDPKRSVGKRTVRKPTVGKGSEIRRTIMKKDQPEEIAVWKGEKEEEGAVWNPEANQFEW